MNNAELHSSIKRTLTDEVADLALEVGEFYFARRDRSSGRVRFVVSHMTVDHHTPAGGLTVHTLRETAMHSNYATPKAAKIGAARRNAPLLRRMYHARLASTPLGRTLLAMGAA